MSEQAKTARQRLDEWVGTRGGGVWGERALVVSNIERQGSSGGMYWTWLVEVTEPMGENSKVVVTGIDRDVDKAAASAIDNLAKLGIEVP